MWRMYQSKKDSSTIYSQILTRWKWHALIKYYRIVLLFYFYFPFSILRKKKKKVKRTLTFVISLSFIIHIWSMYMVRLRPNSCQKSLFRNISWYSDRWKLKFKFHFTLLSGEFKKKKKNLCSVTKISKQFFLARLRGVQ